MRIILPILISFILFSCGNEEEKNKKQGNEKNGQIESLELQISAIDSTLQDLLQLEIYLKDLEMNTFIFVNDFQNRSSECRLQIKKYENYCRKWDLKNPNLFSDEIKKINVSLESDLDSLLNITQDIQELLPNFESFENISNIFIAKILIEGDGEMNLVLNKIYQHIEKLKAAILSSKKKKKLELKKLR